MSFPIPTAAPSSSPAPASAQRLARWIASPTFMGLFIFLLGLVVFTRNNQFRYYYHPDESGKVEQVAQGRRNFNHPLLMLTTTRLAITLSPFKKKHLSRQQIVVFGRWVVAAFAAGSAVALALLARSLAGPLTGWVTGAAVLSDRLLFELAHYMKEDPVLVFGLAATLLALRFLEENPSRNALILLGTACATAAAGKYIGLVSLPFGIAAVCSMQKSPLTIGRRLLIFGAAAVAAWLLFNPQILTKPALLFKGFGRETRIVVEGHKGLYQDVPHAYYLVHLRTTIPIWISAFAGLHLLHMLFRPKGRSFSEWSAAGIAVIVLVLISCTPKTASRYFLPLSVLTPFLASLGVGSLTRILPANLRLRQGLCAGAHLAFLGAVWFTQSHALAARNIGFTRESRWALRSWVEQNLPENAVIAQDDRVNLPSPEKQEHRAEKPMAQKILRSEFVADLAGEQGLSGLRSAGVTHVAVSSPTYERFFDGRFTPSASVADSYARRRQFYEDLFTRGQLLWSDPRGTIMHLEPGLRLYALPLNP